MAAGADAGATPSSYAHQQRSWGGGALAESETGSLQVSIFPSTRETQVTVALDDTDVATLGFEPVIVDPCRLSAADPFDLQACGALLVVRWESGLDYVPGEVELVDMMAFDAETDRALGTYVMGLDGTNRGLAITFGFERPESPMVKVVVNEVYGPADGITWADPPIVTGFELVDREVPT